MLTLLCHLLATPGLVLSTQDIQRALAHKFGVCCGLVSILLITPVLGAVMRTIPLQPQEFTTGLLIFCIVPTT